MTKLATIEKIHSISVHPNADNLCIAKIKEWPVVVPKDKFKEEDLVVFIRIDSILPKDNPHFSFMEKQKYRVWNARFRGAPSQGLVQPLSILPVMYVAAAGPSDIEMPDIYYLVTEGQDVTETLGITKYEKPLDVTVAGDAKGNFPLHLISITDEDNLLNYPEVLKEFRNELCYLSIKADGSSMTVIHENGNVSVCSRRLEQKEGTGFWKIAYKYDLPNKLIKLGKNIAIQTEACGGKIQGNPMALEEPSMFVFNVKDISNGKYYGLYEIYDLCNELLIPTVPQFGPEFIFDDTWDITRLQKLANDAVYSINRSKEPRPAEGLVLRTVVPKYSHVLNKSLSVKILNQEYK